jgi:hypothetical protein
MMRESSPMAPTPARPFPWYCPRCREKEVRRETIPYQCERVVNGQPITVKVAQLAVPRCGNCGELVFDYAAEGQINQACLAATGGSEADRIKVNGVADGEPEKRTA